MVVSLDETIRVKNNICRIRLYKHSDIENINGKIINYRPLLFALGVFLKTNTMANATITVPATHAACSG